MKRAAQKCAVFIWSNMNLDQYGLRTIYGAHNRAPLIMVVGDLSDNPIVQNGMYFVIHHGVIIASHDSWYIGVQARWRNNALIMV